MVWPTPAASCRHAARQAVLPVGINFSDFTRADENKSVVTPPASCRVVMPGAVPPRIAVGNAATGDSIRPAADGACKFIGICCRYLNEVLIQRG